MKCYYRIGDRAWCRGGMTRLAHRPLHSLSFTPDGTMGQTTTVNYVEYNWRDGYVNVFGLIASADEIYHKVHITVVFDKRHIPKGEQLDS